MMLEEHTIPEQQWLPVKTSYWQVFDFYGELSAIFQKVLPKRFWNISDEKKISKLEMSLSHSIHSLL